MRIVFLFFISFQYFSVGAQPQQPAKLFLHTDKAIYVNNEYIWFSAYLLNSTVLDTQYHTLYTVLCDRNKKEPVLSERFIINRGFGQGAILLLDSLPAGEYNLLAYFNGDTLDHRSPLFYQPISLRSIKTPSPVLKVAADTIQLPKDLTQRVQITLQPDSLRYHNRSLSRWKVKVVNEEGEPVQALFSVSCVYKKRTLPGVPDIVAYSSLRSFAVQDSLIQIPVSGKVQDGNKKVKKRLSMVAFSPTGMTPFTTKEDGTFQLTEQELLAEAGTRLLITVSEKKNNQFYNIFLQENAEILNKELAKLALPTVTMPKEEEVFSEEEQKVNKSIMETVVIKTKSKDDYYPEMPPGIDPCNAWVCSCDHWLCNGCKPILTPTVGKRYTEKTTGRSFIFRSCKEDEFAFIKSLKATNLPKSFYVKDYSKDDLPGMEVSTTLYWNNLLITNEKGEATFSFYTNDLTGDFTCTLQGISEEGPFSANAKIQVVKN